MVKRSVTIRDQVKRSVREMRVVERRIEEAHGGMITLLQVWPVNVEGGHEFLVRASIIRSAITEVWEDLDHLCHDMGFPHKTPPKGEK